MSRSPFESRLWAKPGNELHRLAVLLTSTIGLCLHGALRLGSNGKTCDLLLPDRIDGDSRMNVGTLRRRRDASHRSSGAPAAVTQQLALIS